MTPEEYKNYHNARKVKKDKPPIEKVRMTTRQAIEAMSEYYEFDKKKTEFFIRQLELSGKI
jgi:hypothetical protein